MYALFKIPSISPQIFFQMLYSRFHSSFWWDYLLLPGRDRLYILQEPLPNFIRSISSLPVFPFLAPPKFPRSGNSCGSCDRNNKKVPTSRHIASPVIRATSLGYADPRVSHSQMPLPSLVCWLEWGFFSQPCWDRWKSKTVGRSRFGWWGLGKLHLNHSF